MVLNFWASFCHPCREEFPLFREQLAAHPGEFVVLGVDTKDIESDAKQFAKDKKATWPIVVDGEQRTRARRTASARCRRRSSSSPTARSRSATTREIPDDKWSDRDRTITTPSRRADTT